MKLASFDIFDTTLFRRCGYADIVFKQLACRLYPDNEALQNAFVFWRTCLAEKNAKRNTPYKEVTLTDIYSGIDKGFTEIYSAEQIVNAEREIEAENLIANPKVKKLINKKRDEGFVIAFISDMYLDSNFLRSILLREGCATSGDLIFVSCENCARKDTGLLYKNIRKKYSPSIWIHYGDNYHSDVKMARKNGIKAIKIDTSFSPAEMAMERSGGWTRKNEFRILTGISRFQRLLHENSPEAILAADYIAPTYLPYVMYILRHAESHGIKKLYFLSRDSYILMRAAQSFSVTFKDIELKYLFVSRRSLLLPYLAFGCEANNYMNIIHTHTIINKKVSSLLNQLDSNLDELSNYGIKFSYERIKNKDEELDFLAKIFNSSFTPILKDKAVNAKNILVEYFQQEGLMDGVKCAAVDVGWLGTTRWMMNRILRQCNCNDVFFYYFGVRNDVLPASAGNYISYFQQSKLNLRLITTLIEHYYSFSPYPTTIGYVKTDKGTIEPKFPFGHRYLETPIINLNVHVIEQMSIELSKSHIVDDTLLFFWAAQSFTLLFDSKIPINFSPLLQCPSFDSQPFVKKLSLKEMFQLILLGHSITAFDYGSVCITFSKSLCSYIFNIQKSIMKMKMAVKRLISML